MYSTGMKGIQLWFVFNFDACVIVLPNIILHGNHHHNVLVCMGYQK
jgi:hypothetical protein